MTSKNFEILERRGWEIKAIERDLVMEKMYEEKGLVFNTTPGNVVLKATLFDTWIAKCKRWYAR